MKKKLEKIKFSLPKLKKLAASCRFCMHECKVNRLKNKKGVCNATSKIAVYSYSPHNGEEPPISGGMGSGTIFFKHCSLKCVYCQNYQFSQETNLLTDVHSEVSAERLAEQMLKLERIGCHNINFVSPTHYSYWIVKALGIAIKNSFNLPIVFNTGGYDNIEMIKLLDGLVDIYLPDMRYSDDKNALKFSFAPHYTKSNRQMVKEMFRQTGTLSFDNDGIAKKGVLVRLLILPDNASGTIDTLKFLEKEVSNDIYVSIMSQYYPTYNAEDYPEIKRQITRKEYDSVVDAVHELGFKNGWIQDFETDLGHFLGTNIKPN